MQIWLGSDILIKVCRYILMVIPEIQWNRAHNSNKADAFKKQFYSKQWDVKKYIDAK